MVQLYFFLPCFSVALISSSYADGCRLVEYLPSVANKALTGHVITAVQVNNEGQCKIQCYMEAECVSFNLRPYNLSGHTCELSRSDHVRDPDDLVPMSGYIYKGTKNRCSSSRCPNNATCLSMTPKEFHCVCPEGFTGSSCQTATSCRHIKTNFPNASNGVYPIHPVNTPEMFSAYCDMTSFGGGWTMCYTTDDTVRLRTEVTYDEDLPYGTNGYRTDCNRIEFREILFVDESTEEKAFFAFKLNTTLVAAENYGRRLDALWVGGGVADVTYEYQLLICDASLYSGFFISGYTNCYKQCHSWCGDGRSPYFRSASFHSNLGGIAFNTNGHLNVLSNKVLSVGIR